MSLFPQSQRSYLIPNWGTALVMLKKKWFDTLASEGSGRVARTENLEVAMKPQTQTESKPMQALRQVALRYPEAEEGGVCTRRAFKARNKAFLFMGMDDRSYNVMVKLCEALAEAAQRAVAEPKNYKVGAHGWVTATFAHDQSSPPGLLERWIDESYRLLVPKQLVALLPGPAATEKKQAPKKSVKKKSSAR